MLRMALALGLSLLAAAPAAAASVDGAAIHSSIQGSGKTIVFVHGWTCDETSWAGQVPAFDDDYRVITLDLPGPRRLRPGPGRAVISLRLRSGMNVGDRTTFTGDPANLLLRVWCHGGGCGGSVAGRVAA